MGAMGFTPPGFRTVLKGLGASTETAAAMVEAMENLLRNTTRKLWKKRNTEQHEEEKHRGIKEEQKRDPVAAKEWRERNPTVTYFNDEEVEEDEPGMVTRDEGGKVLTKACTNCKMIHSGTDQKCKRCKTDLPSGARIPQNPMTREHVARPEDGYWGKVVKVGEKWARNYDVRDKCKKVGAMWRKVVKSRGRGRDVDAPAGGPRGPNSESTPDDEECDYEDYYFDDTDEDVNSDDEDYNNGITGDESSPEREEQGRTKIRKMMTHGGRMIMGRKRKREEDEAGVWN
jgi:hypothetical protein